MAFRRVLLLSSSVAVVFSAAMKAAAALRRHPPAYCYRGTTRANTPAVCVRASAFAPLPPQSSSETSPTLTSLSATASSSSSSSSSAPSAATTGWMKVDWPDPAKRVPPSSSSSSSSSSSPVERFVLRDRLVHFKRDDRLTLPGSNVSGNKARKFYALNSIEAADFPDCVVSYGGPQSNAMAALAAVVRSKNAEISGEAAAAGGDGDVDDEFDDDDAYPSSPEFEDVFGPMDTEDEEGRLASSSDLSDSSSASPSAKEDDANGDGQEAMPFLPERPPTTMETTNDEQHKQETKRKIRFIYYTKKLPRYLRKQPSGNLLRATALGMELRETDSHVEYAELFGGLHGGSLYPPADLDPPVPGRSLWIPQGGASPMAAEGAHSLAEEIVDYWSEHGRGDPLAVCVPGGTCSTALLLHRSLGAILSNRSRNEEEMDVRVVVIPCVGDDDYALRQMSSLDRALGGGGSSTAGTRTLPDILKPRPDVSYGSALRRKTNGYFSFGTPSTAILDAYDELIEEGLFVDLLYGAPAWALLLQNWEDDDNNDRGRSSSPIAGRQIMYVHSGGLEGVASQLTRYKHKGLLDAGRG